jgi:phosphate transport system permease protein
VASNAEAVDIDSGRAAALLAGNTDEMKVLAQLGVVDEQAGVHRERVSQHSSLIFTSDDPLRTERVWCVHRLGYIESSNAQQYRLVEWPQHEVSVASIASCIAVNQLSLAQRVGNYVSRWQEFLFDWPREANTAGGVFPAIWGTVVLTMIMTVAVVPFGVIAALYLREYTGAGPLVGLIRLSINNLAGVPSILYGVFGLVFFCYTLGAFIDGGPRNADIRPLPPAIWYVWLAVLVTVGTAALFCMVAINQSGTGSKLRLTLSRAALVLWLICFAIACLLIFKSPYFDGFYTEDLPNPTFGKGGLLWASLTLALLTLPVVIVTTEQALSAVPNALREASLACGASKWQTIRRIIIPFALPGIATGGVLAMSRAVGQVAPLMLVGAIPAAPDLPLDGEFPYLHASRSFMHLSYQVYVLGMQSQDTEATRPLVFACILVLVILVSILNLAANYLRSQMRRRVLQDRWSGI